MPSRCSRARADPILAGKMGKMVGFRNVAVHDYQALNLRIVQAIVTGHLDDFLAFARWALQEGGA